MPIRYVRSDKALKVVLVTFLLCQVPDNELRAGMKEMCVKQRKRKSYFYLIGAVFYVHFTYVKD
jgi:hypothetical protein